MSNEFSTVQTIGSGPSRTGWPGAEGGGAALRWEANAGGESVFLWPAGPRFSVFGCAKRGVERRAVFLLVSL